MEKELANKPLTLRSHTRWDFIGGANTEDKRDSGSTPGQGRSPGGGHGNPLQYSCLENPGAWWATVHRVTESLT